MDLKTGGTLFIVSTPIGNMDDITLRAISTLTSINVIFAEDTRSAFNLLNHHKIDTNIKRVISFFEGNEQKRFEEVFKYLNEGIDVALISESGTPLISDPGFKLVRELINNNIKVVSIPGPTAVVAALTSSGFPTNAFLFLGFLPKKESHTRKLLEQTKLSVESIDQVKTIILYESPHRLVDSLRVIQEVFGDIEIAVARELTKVYEEVRREKVSEAIKHFTKTQPRGEFTILLSQMEND